MDALSGNYLISNDTFGKKMHIVDLVPEADKAVPETPDDLD